MPDDPRKVFVAKLPEDIKEDEIRYIFSTYGRVDEVVLLSNSNARGGQRAGFVIYETEDAARAAVQVLDNVYKFREESREAIHVSIAKPRGGGKGDGKGDGKGKDRGGNDYGSDRGGRQPDRGGDSYRDDRGGDSYRDDRGGPRGGDGYGKGGHIRGKGDRYDDRVNDRYDDRRDGPRSNDRYDGRRDDRNNRGDVGKGRDVAYENRDRGYDRGPSDNGRNFDRGGNDRDYDRGRHDGKGGNFDKQRDVDRPRDQGSGSSSGGRKGESGVPGTKLYVGNLPSDIVKEDLEQVFGHYGRLDDVHIMTGRSKSGQASAFVRYSTASEAKDCIAAMAQGYEIRPGEGEIMVKLADGAAGKGEKGRDGGRSHPY